MTWALDLNVFSNITLCPNSGILSFSWINKLRSKYYISTQSFNIIPRQYIVNETGCRGCTTVLGCLWVCGCFINAWVCVKVCSTFFLTSAAKSTSKNVLLQSKLHLANPKLWTHSYPHIPALNAGLKKVTELLQVVLLSPAARVPWTRPIGELSNLVHNNNNTTLMPFNVTFKPQLSRILKIIPLHRLFI